MNLKKLMIYSLAPVVLALWHGYAFAALKFGTTEHIRFIANTSLQGPAGEQLYLARKITEKSFLLPYTIEDNGFVLGISGESKRYFPFPPEEKLATLQRAGYLPTPLPAYELNTLDLVYGHVLWIALMALAAYGGYKYFFRHRTPLTTSQPQAHSGAAVEKKSHNDYADLTLPVKLYPSRFKTLVLLIVSVMFVISGLVFRQANPVMAYLCVGLFGLGILVFLVQLIPGSAYLELASDSFTFSSLFKKSTVYWKDVAGFRVAKITRSKKMVGIEFNKTYPEYKVGRALASALTGVQGALPDTYGMKAEALADLMNEIKKRHAVASF